MSSGEEMQFTPKPMTQPKRPFGRLAPSSSRPESLAPPYSASLGHLSCSGARRQAPRASASTSATPATKPSCGGDGRRRGIDQQQAGVEIAGRRRPFPAEPPPARVCCLRDDPQPAGIAASDPARRLVIGRAERLEFFQPVASRRSRAAPKNTRSEQRLGRSGRRLDQRRRIDPEQQHRQDDSARTARCVTVGRSKAGAASSK